MEKIKVEFIKAMYPYKAWDIWFVKQSILDTYPEYVKEYKEPKAKEAKKVENKQQTKKSTKSL